LTPNGHDDLPVTLNNLGICFLSRFQQTGDLADVSEAIKAHERANQFFPNGHPSPLQNLAKSYRSRFETTGDLSDISEAISANQRAVQLTPNNHPEMPARLNNLGNSFLCRFESTGDLPDLSEAISAQLRAIELATNGYMDISGILNNFGLSLHARFNHTGDLSDISEAISAQQRAIRLTPNDHIDMPGRLNNLGSSFRARFEHTRNISDISKAISTQQRAVQLTPNGHALMPVLLHNLATYLKSRFEHAGNLSDISEAISIQQRAIQLTPNGHAKLPNMLKTLGGAFDSRFQHTGDASDFSTAVHFYQKSATTSGPPSVRLTAAKKWAESCMSHGLPGTMEAYTVAIDLISQVAGMHRTVEQRHTDLTIISSLSTSAASAAFALDEVEKALEWLEQGRCLVWSQLNQLRTPADELRAHDARLAQRFLDISAALESSGSRSGSERFDVDSPLPVKMSVQDEAQVHLKRAGEWNQLLEEIRNIPGFHNFLRPPQASELLRRIPPDGPIILINVHESRCDALALMSDCNEPIHIPLENFTYKQAATLRDSLRHFLASNGVRMREENRAIRPVPNPRIKSDIHFVLGVLWLEVVKPVLEGLGFTVSFCFFIVLTLVFIHFLPSLLLYQTQVGYGGAQQVHSYFFHCMPLESMVKSMTSRHHLAPAFPTLQYLRTLPPSVLSFESARTLSRRSRNHHLNSSSSANRTHQAALQSRAP